MPYPRSRERQARAETELAQRIQAIGRRVENLDGLDACSTCVALWTEVQRLQRRLNALQPPTPAA